MPRCWWCIALAAALAACGTQDDERPVTVEVLTLTVLAPNCGQVQCHSTFTRTKNLAFDTVEEATLSLADSELDILNPARDPLDNDLMNVLEGDGKERMPPDAPLLDQDYAFIVRWLEAGHPGVQ